MKITIHNHTSDGTRSTTSDGSKSGTVTVDAAIELALGDRGWGEADYAITMKYNFSLEYKNITSVDWYDKDGKKNKNLAPLTEIIAECKKDLQRHFYDYLDRGLDKL